MNDRPERRFIHPGLLLLVSVVVLAACDLVVFNQEAIQGLEEARRMSEVVHFEIADWDERDGDGIVHPFAFLPDDVGSRSGYLLASAEEGRQLLVFRVRRGSLAGITDVFHGGSRGLFEWSARVMPFGTDIIDPELSIEPPLLIVTDEDTDGASVRIIYPDPDAPKRDLRVTTLNLPALINARTTLVRATLFAAQVAPGELQMLARDSAPDPPAPLREFFFLADGRDLVLWDLNGQEPGLISPASWRSGAASFARPRLATDEPAPALSYGNARLSPVNPDERRGFLTYRDGAFSGAPLRTLTWLTNPDDPASGSPQAVSAWQYPIHSVSAEGLLRSADTGRIVTVDSRSNPGNPEEAVTRRRDYGSLWYAGHYPDGDTYRDLYSSVGLARSIQNWTLSVTVYRD